jgi:hypothetical protein
MRTRMRVRHRQRPLPGGRAAAVLLLALPLALGACGGGGGDGDGVATLNGGGGQQAQSGDQQASKDPQERALEWAKCMRANGVNVPDPEVDDEGRMKITMGAGRGTGNDPKKMEAAQEKCQRLLPSGGEGGPSKPDPQMQDQLLKFARCMREHGIDMPDPKMDDGGIRLEIGKDQDPDSPKFKQAQEACRQYAPEPPGEKARAGK